MEKIKGFVTGLFWVLVAYAAVVAFVFYPTAQFNYGQYGVTVYRGIVFPWIDMVVQPDGKPGLRKAKDWRLITLQEVQALIGKNSENWPDTVILGTGPKQCAKVEAAVVQQRVGPLIEQYTTPKAIERFNELRGGGGKVAAIIHSGC